MGGFSIYKLWDMVHTISPTPPNINPLSSRIGKCSHSMLLFRCLFHFSYISIKEFLGVTPILASKNDCLWHNFSLGGLAPHLCSSKYFKIIQNLIESCTLALLSHNFLSQYLSPLKMRLFSKLYILLRYDLTKGF